MKFMFTLLLMFLLPFAGIAQTYTLSGTVCDDKGTLPFATIMVWQGNDTIKAIYGVSDNQGKFAVRGLNEGRYKGMVKFTGFERLSFEVNLDKDICLDTLRLRPGDTRLVLQREREYVDCAEQGGDGAD